MTAAALLEASSRVEPAIVAVATTLAVLALLVVAIRGLRRVTDGSEMSLPLELGLLAVVLAVAVVTRTAGYAVGWTAPLSLSTLTALDVGKMLADGTLWTQWLALFGYFESGAIQNSAMLLPVAAAFQWVLGPSLHLPLLIGAFYGTVAVLLAWAFGRVAVSSAFGLAFASLLAISPLQIVWARLGGIHVTVVTHVLLAAWCGHLAGKRGSPWLAVLTGAVMWASLYQYAAARVAFVVAPAMIVAGLASAGTSGRRARAVLLTTVATMIAIYAVLRPPLGSLWPAYPGYVGNKGERSVAELVTQNVAPIRRQLGLALERYFLIERAGAESPVPPYRWGMRSGGLCPVPVALLGMIGLVATLRHPIRGWPFLLLAAVGLAVPVLSVTTARRLLLFDLAWCAFASIGVLLLVRASRRLGASARASFAVAAVTLVAIGGWSFASVLALNAALPARHDTPIPFGESGFGDGLTCRRCQRAGYEWRDEIARGSAVVSFDTDLDREMLTVAYLRLYGRLAALSVQRPEAFIDFYPVMQNYSLDIPGRVFDPTQQNFASYLRQRLEGLEPATILWHFERPTQWERWLAGRLVEAGGTTAEFDTPLGLAPGLQVRTDWSRREPAFRVLEDLAVREHPSDGRCSTLRVVDARPIPFAVLRLAAAAGGPIDRQPEWLAGSWDRVAYGSRTFGARVPVGTDVESDRDGATRVRVLTREATELVVGDGEVSDSGKKVLAAPELLGLDCAVRIGADWWAVDPTSGSVLTTASHAGWIPEGRWIAIARGGAEHLVLGSADQFVAVFDVGRRIETARFPATLSPSRRFMVNECSPLVVGTEWSGTFDHLTSVLTLYDRTGRAAGSHDLSLLDGFAGAGAPISAVAATGRYLAVGRGGTVATVAVTIDSDCPVDPPARADS